MKPKEIPTQKTFNVESYDFTKETKKQLLQGRKEHNQEVAIHTDPILPDDVDEYGNLPRLRCGWSKCGKTFESREQLIQHIKECIPNVFVDRLHVNCKNVLTNDPDMVLADFMKLVRECYDDHTQQYIHNAELEAYYHKFQPLFKSHQFSKGDAKMTAQQKETAEILFNYKIEADKAKVVEREHHFGLPDLCDSYGNLPKLRCGYSQCAKVFVSKNALLEHVKECIPYPLINRFHVNCKTILESNPDLTLTEFEQKVKDCYDEEMQKNIIQQELIDYYNKFQPSFKKHQVMEKDAMKIPAAQKDKAQILFNLRVKSQKKLMEQDNIPKEFED